MIHLACAECHKTFKADAKFAGRKTKCPRCSAALLIPDNSRIQSPTTPPLPTAIADSDGSGFPMKLLLSLLGTAVVFASAFLIWFFALRDSWEVDNLIRLSDALHQAEELQRTDPWGAYKIYDSILQESSQHRITIDTLSSSLTNASQARDKLRPIVEQQLADEQKERERLAEEAEKAAEAEKARLAEEERKKVEEAEAARKLQAEEQSKAARRKEAASAYQNLPPSAREALNMIKRIDARVEIGINYADYSSIVGEAWAEVKLFIESPEGQKLPEYCMLLAKAVDDYKLALDIWRAKIEHNALYADNNDVDALQQLCWLQAGLWIGLAESLLSGNDIGKVLDDIQAAVSKQDNLREKWSDLEKEILNR